MENFLQFGALSLVFVLFVVGIAGIIVPLLPGILLIWGAVLFYAVTVDDFTLISPLLFSLITLIGLVAGTADLWLPLLGAKKTGASWKTLLLGVVGAIAGTFLLPILGTIAGYMAGIVLGEYLRLGALEPALRASIGGLVGWGVGTALQLAGGVTMIILFLMAVF